MAFKPTISACLESGCTNLVVTDTTGIYDVSTNPYGWEDAGTLAAADLASATILIEYVDEDGDVSTVSTTDVLSQIADPVTGTFEFDPIVGDYPDGQYIITYTLIDSSDVTYRKSINTFLFCNVKCCVQQLLATVPDLLCNCNYSETLQELFDAQVMLEGLKANATCGNTTAMYQVLTRLQRLCDFENCDCN